MDSINTMALHVTSKTLIKFSMVSINWNYKDYYEADLDKYHKSWDSFIKNYFSEVVIVRDVCFGFSRALFPLWVKNRTREWCIVLNG